MQFPIFPQAEGWRDADDVSPPLRSRQLHALTLVAALAALGAAAGLNLIDDPRPLDVQLSASLSRAGETLKGWQGQLSRGLQVSLRAVADGHDHPPTDPDEGQDQPVRPGGP